MLESESKITLRHAIMNTGNVSGGHRHGIDQSRGDIYE